MLVVKLNLFGVVLILFAPILPTFAAEPGEVPLIKPAKSLHTGLPFLPDLDLSGFSTDEFIRLSSSVGTNRIRRQWTSPVLPLPPHPRGVVHGLTLEEVNSYMNQVPQLFKDGKANPLSDVGLVSTQEDVIRQPMLNHIAAF